MSMPPPSGRRRSWVHYGVMVPGLPDPFRYFDVMAIVGTPGVRMFANDHLITTTPNDTAYVVSATSTTTHDAFRAYSIANDCEFEADGSRVRFGDDLLIEGLLPHITVRRRHPQADVRLELDVTDVITRFVDLPGIYRHWSRLAFARGTIDGVEIAAPGTVEYAWGVGVHSVVDRRVPLHLPGRFFTYHVLNVDDETQLLFAYALGPLGRPVQRAVHVRTRDGATAHRRGRSWSVHEETTATTPDGRTMSLPQQFSWGAEGVCEIHGTAAGDWTYGLGAGYVGSYDYEGTYRGQPISGRAYAEYIDLR